MSRRKNTKECSESTTENLTGQLLHLKETFTQVLNAICYAIEKDCGVIGNEEQEFELKKIKQKYTKLKDEVSKIISEFAVTSPQSKEENAIVQEGLQQCMVYLDQVHKSMESTLRKYDGILDNNIQTKYEENFVNVCCDRRTPHIHKDIDGNQIILNLKKGTQSEEDYVTQLMNNVNDLPLDKKKKIIHKLCNMNESQLELNAGNEDNIPMPSLTYPNRPPRRSHFPDETSICSVYSSSHFLKPNSNYYQNKFNRNVQMQSKPEEIRQTWHFPDKVMESLLEGYNCNSDFIKHKHLFENNELFNTNLTKTKLDNNYNSDTLERKLFQEQGTIVHSEKLRGVYDSNGNPLIDYKGVPLKNINGQMLVKFCNNKPVSTLNGDPIFDENSLPFVGSLDKPLYNVEGKPIRLYNQNGIPLTDDKGYVLKLANGKFAIKLDKYNRLTSDASGRPLYDSNGEQVTDIDRTPQLVHANSANLLKADDRSTHSDSKGNNTFLWQVEGSSPGTSNMPIAAQKSDACYSDINQFDTKSKSILAVYDCNKYPLTSSDGNILRNVENKEMVEFDIRGRPIKDYAERLVYDAAGNPSNSSKFNPFLPINYQKKRIYPSIGIQLYDIRGHPVLDFDGSALTTSDGKLLVSRCENGETVHGLNKGPLFDKSGVPLTKIKGSWTTSKGLPYRVFDIKGFPLTNERGEELFDIKQNSLIKLDGTGRPVLTASGSPVHDVNGTPATLPQFNPNLAPTTNITRKVYIHNKPMKVFNHNGMPLSDAAGIAMLDAKGNDLIQFNDRGIPIRDSDGNRIFDEHKVPLNCQKGEPIIYITGKPIRIYDCQGRPLTDINGVPLNLANDACTIKFDSAGRPVSDFRNCNLHDAAGRMLNDQLFDPQPLKEEEHIRLTKNDGRPLQIYNSGGMPLTDSNGIILINSDGTHLKINSDSQSLSDFNGDPVYNESGQILEQTAAFNENVELEKWADPFGRPFKDACGELQFDEYGRPRYDLYRRRLYDDNGRPLTNAYGKYLISNLVEPTEVDPGFDPIILSKKADSDTKSLTDLIGGPLYDSYGNPLYNQYGKPIVDIYGRPLYDNEGLPLCDLNGKPVSELVRQNGIPVEVEDVYKRINATKEVADLIENSTLTQTKKIINPHIPAIWIMPSTMNNINDNNTNSGRIQHNNHCDQHHDKIMYWALIRKTTFIDGKVSFEILKADRLKPDG